MMTQTELRDLVRRAVYTSGMSQAAWARRYGICPAYLCQVISGYTNPGPKFLQALGLKRVVLYDAIENAAPNEVSAAFNKTKRSLSADPQATGTH